MPDLLSRSVPLIDAVEIRNGTFDPENIEDHWYLKIVGLVNETLDRYPAWRVEDAKLLKHERSKSAELRDGTTELKVVVPKDLRRALISDCHDNVAAGYLETNKTYWKTQELYYWPKILAGIGSYVKRCTVCAQHNVEQKPPPDVWEVDPSSRIPGRP